MLDFKEVVKKLPEQESNCIICAFCLAGVESVSTGRKGSEMQAGMSDGT